MHKQGISEKEILWDLLRLQTSTDERLEIIDNYYAKIFDITGVLGKITEYGCGVNALTYPWMDDGIEYVGFDVDKELIKFINNVFSLLGYAPKAKVRLGDVLIGEFEESDITLLLKVLILFERQVSGVELEILRGIPSKYIVVSYPTQSISGRKKGMVEKYRSDFYKLIQDEGWLIREILFTNEIVFIIEK
jgi:16S rRNA (guanine(1405)-N(7))-methyltransferase